LRRKLLVYGLKLSTPLSLGEIAKLTGMKTISAVSHTVGRLEADVKDDKVLEGIVERLVGQCRTGQRP